MFETSMRYSSRVSPAGLDLHAGEAEVLEWGTCRDGVPGHRQAMCSTRGLRTRARALPDHEVVHVLDVAIAVARELVHVQPGELAARGGDHL
jgi:hypothetical protein